jgi:hypothetical protein
MKNPRFLLTLTAVAARSRHDRLGYDFNHRIDDFFCKNEMS